MMRWCDFNNWEESLILAVTGRVPAPRESNAVTIVDQFSGVSERSTHFPRKAKTDGALCAAYRKEFFEELDTELGGNLDGVVEYPPPVKHGVSKGKKVEYLDDSTSTSDSGSESDSDSDAGAFWM
jgi:hypothetical protein